MKKGVLITIIAASATVIVGGVVTYLAVTGKIGGRFFNRVGRDSAIVGDGGDARFDIFSNPYTASLPENADIVTPGPTSTLWDAAMDNIITVPSSVFTPKEETAEELPDQDPVPGKSHINHTYWNHVHVGTTPGPLRSGNLDPDIYPYHPIANTNSVVSGEPRLVYNIGNGFGIKMDSYEYDQGYVSFITESGENGTAGLGETEYVFNSYTRNTTFDREMPIACVDDCAYFITYECPNFGDYYGYSGKNDCFEADEVYLAKFDTTASGDESDPYVTHIKIDGLKLSTLSKASDSYDAKNRVNLCADNDKVYIMSYNTEDNSSFTMYVYDVATENIEKSQMNISDIGFKPLMGNGMVVEDDVVYMLYCNMNIYAEVTSSWNYTFLAVMGHDLKENQTFTCDEFGVKSFMIGYLHTPLLKDGSEFKTDYSGSLCKNDSGIYFESDSGIMFRKRGEKTASVIFENQEFEIRTRYSQSDDEHNMYECRAWSITGDYLYYSDCYVTSSYNSHDDSKQRPDDFMIYRKNLVTGEVSRFCIYDVLLEGTFADVDNVGDTVADYENDRLEYKFICGIAGNTCAFEVAGYMEYITIGDDGWMTHNYFDYSTHSPTGQMIDTHLTTVATP